MDIKNFISATTQIAEEKGIPPKKVLETIEVALAAAYKKDYGKKGQLIRCQLNSKAGKTKFWQVKLVVDTDMIYSEKELAEMKAKNQQEEGGGEAGEEGKKVRFNSEKHIMLTEAQKIKPKIKGGEEFEIELETKENYGRIAAQTAKQVIIQRVREMEKENIFSEYKSKEGEIVSGIVQRVENKNVFFDLGRVLGFLPKEEQIPGEFYRIGQRLKVYILKVEENPKGPLILLSRAYPKLVSKLFELEVPEVLAKEIQIKAIAREPSSRTKIAVLALQEGIDPIGSMVGPKGARVMAVINELGGEKIDIIEYSEKAEEYIANSLAPAKILEVKIMPKNRALVTVHKEQLSLAIGKNGQNVRLAAKLTGWKIDVRDEQGELIKTVEIKEKNN